MVETKKKKILKSKENLFQAGQKVGYKEGAPIEKGVVLNEEYLEKAGSVLVTLRKQSKVGVTEMEILKHIYQNGLDNTNYQSQASLSFTTLELTK